MIRPFQYQIEAHNATFNYLATSTGNGLVCMPTGTGKSICISMLVYDIFRSQPFRRIMLLTHVWKLIDQNVKKLYEFWPTAPVGIHSAGLDSRDTIMPIIYGGVQSVVKNIEAFGWRDLLIIDEAHLLSPNEDTQYGEIIGGLKKINPNLRVIGYTATPYRLKLGMLTEGGIFNDIIFDITDFNSFNRLIDEGYLAPLIGKPTETKIDVSKVQMVAGDFNQKQAEAAVDTDENTYNAIKEIIDYGSNRGTWMLFGAGVNNAEHLAGMLQSFNIPAACVHSKLTPDENKNRLKSYDAGELRAIVGANMLTTGYDNDRIDLIADLQMTTSPGKHVQKYGRGTRVCRTQGYRKDNCLALDFVGNIWRNGPINDPLKPRKPGEKTGDAPVKICTTDKLVQPADGAVIKGCGAYNHASVRFCCNCAGQFNFQSKVYGSARNDAPLRLPEAPIYETVDVKNVTYARHEGKEKAAGIVSPPTVRAAYTLGLRTINKFLCFEHVGFPRHNAHDWWKKHHPGDPPATVTEFLYMSENGELRTPKKVVVHVNIKYPEIVNYEF